VPICNFHAEAYVESLVYEFVRHEKAFSRLTVEGVAASAILFSDLSGELAVEVRQFQVTDELLAADPLRPDFGWKHIVKPLSDSKIVRSAGSWRLWSRD
jgi:hypothetical protein